MTDANGTAPVESKNGEGQRDYATAFPGMPAKKQLSCFAKKSGSLIGRNVGNRNNQVSTNVTIPRNERKHSASLAASSQEIRRQCIAVANMTKTNISYSQNKDDSLQVIIKGPNDAACTQAKAKIRQVLQSQESLDINIEKKYHRYILGRQGNSLRELEANTGTKVRIPGPSDASSIISISGPKEGITQARTGILDIVKRQGSRAVEKLEIPKLYHQFIAGAYNKTKERIESQCGIVKVNIPPNNKPEATEISITGDKDSVAAAKVMVMAIYDKKRDRLTEVSVDIPKHQHRHVVGNRASGIQDILEKYEVLVEVPKSDEEGETITLRGEAMNIGQALNEVYVRANSFVENLVAAPSWCMRKLIGKGGSGIKELNPYNSGDNFVKVNFVDDKEQIEISGLIKPVEEVTRNIKNKIREILMSFTQREINIPQKHHGRIIGQKGANLIKFREGRENLNIRVPAPSDKSETITIEGSPEDVNAVFKELAALAQDFANEKEIKLNFEHKYHQYFFRGNTGPDKGKKERFDDMKSKFNDISIQFPSRDNESDNTVMLRGPSHIADYCAKELQMIYNEIVNEHYTGNLLVQKKFHGNIIGRGGSVISKIKEDCSVQIEIPPNDASTEVIKVIGTKSNVERAKAKIREIENELATIAEARVIIPKASYKFLIGQGGAKISVLRDEFEVAIQFPDESSKSEEVIIRGEQDKVEKAKIKLQQLAKEKQENYHTVQVACPTADRKFLVGKKGAARSAFQSQFSVSLQIPDGENDKISIVGKKEHVAKAQVELTKRIKELGDIKETTIDVEKKYHIRLIRGGFLTNFNEEFSTRVQLPETAKDSTEVKIKGPKTNVDKVVKSITEIVARFDKEATLVFELPTKERRALIGERGKTVNEIQSAHNVTISIKPKDNGEEEETTEATVTGPKDQLDAVRDKLMALVTYEDTFSLAEDFHGLLLGPKGQTIQELSKQWHITIKVPKKDEEDKETIKIRGTRDNLEKAKAELEIKKTEWESQLEELYLQSYQCEVEVPQIFHRKLIGQKGENIKELSEKYEVRIKVQQNDDNVTITGYKDKVHECVDYLNNFVSDLVSHVTKDVEIDNAVHRRIIGQRGRGVRKLMKDHDVDIKFPNERDSDYEEKKNIVSVSGLSTSVDDAIDALTELENEMLTETGEDVVDARYVPSVPGQQAFRDKADHEAKSNKKPQRQQGKFQVNNAPWSQQGGDTTANSEAFPTLGGAGSGEGSRFMGAWGNRR